MTLYDVLIRIGAVSAGEEARRLIAQGAVTVDGEITTEPQTELDGGYYEILVRRRIYFEVAINAGSLYLCGDGREFKPIKDGDESND